MAAAMLEKSVSDLANYQKMKELGIDPNKKMKERGIDPNLGFSGGGGSSAVTGGERGRVNAPGSLVGGASRSRSGGGGSSAVTGSVRGRVNASSSRSGGGGSSAGGASNSRSRAVAGGGGSSLDNPLDFISGISGFGGSVGTTIFSPSPSPY